MCACFYYIFYKLISKHKGWILILGISIFYFKGYEYAASLFFLFLVFTILNIKNNFKNYFEIVACAICGVVVFFVKANFGIVALPILAVNIGILIFSKNIRSLLVYFGVILLVFCIIYAKVNIDLVHYVKYSLPMISCYNEAMQIAIDPEGTAFRSAVIYMMIFTGIVLFYFWQNNDRKYSFVKIYSVLLMALMLFLTYKNGFTRADDHTQGFFLMLPLFTIIALFLFDFAGSRKAKIVCIIVIFICDLNVDLPHGGEGKGFINKVTFFYSRNYFQTLFKKQEDRGAEELKIPDDKLKIVGNSTIDIFPIDISIMQLNNLNYDPRPVMQTYAAYNPLLDSLNANHFYKQSRPEFAMVKMGYVDNRYVAWDEPLTHAMLHLNYKYTDFISFNKDTGLVNTDASFLLLRSTDEKGKYPEFEKLFERTVNFEDTVHFDFKDDTPIYMTVDIEATAAGKIKEILYQAPLLHVSLFLNHECTSSLYYEAIRPIIKAPVLISNAICDNLDFREFMVGHSQQNAKIKAFAFHSDGWGYKQKIKLTFYKFSNY